MSNKPVVWAYILLAPGRVGVKTQRAFARDSGADMGAFGTVWEDSIRRGSTRPRAQLVARNDLLRAVEAGDVIAVAEPFALGLSKSDAAWFVGDAFDAGATLLVGGGDDPETFAPGDDVAKLLAAVASKQNVTHVRAAKAKANGAAKKAAPRWKKGPCVYRCFDAYGDLLYVGSSGNVNLRVAQHRLHAPWFSQVDRIAVQPHETREAAFSAESEAIKAEGPVINIKRPKGSVDPFGE